MKKVNSRGLKEKSMSLEERNSNVSKELWWVEILQKKAIKNLECKNKSYKIVEIIDLDDEDDKEIHESDIDLIEKSKSTVNKLNKPVEQVTRKKENNSITNVINNECENEKCIKSTESHGESNNAEETKRTTKEHMNIAKRSTRTSKDCSNDSNPISTLSNVNNNTLENKNTSRRLLQGSERPITSTFQKYNESHSSPNQPTDEQSEVLEVSSKLITLDIQKHFSSNLDMEEEIDKRVNEIVSKERNNAVFTEDLSEDEDAMSIICIEDTKPKSPLLISETENDESGSLPQSPVQNFKENKAPKVFIEDKIVKNDVGASNSIQTNDTPDDNQCSNEHQVINSNKENSRRDYPEKMCNKTRSNKEPSENNAAGSLGTIITTQQSTDDDDHLSISSIVEGSVTYDNIDPKTNDVHIEKISPTETTTNTQKSNRDGAVLFSVTTSKKLSPPSEYSGNTHEEPVQNRKVVFSTCTLNTKEKRSLSPDYSPPILESCQSFPMETDEIKSPPVESFSKSDSDEFKKLFNKNRINPNGNEKENNSDFEDSPIMNGYTNLQGNLIIKRTNQLVPKRSILAKTDGSIQSENISSSTKRKAVSFATITQEKPPLIVSRSLNLDSTILERKTYDSPTTIQNEPQIWRSSINTSPISNQHEQSSNEQEQEVDMLSTSDINSLGSPSSPLIKDSGNKTCELLEYPGFVKKRISNKIYVSTDNKCSDGGNPSPEGNINLFRGQNVPLLETKRVMNGKIHQPYKQSNLLTEKSSSNYERIHKKNSSNKKRSFSRDLKISQRIKTDFEALKQISSRQFKPSESMSDFDRYLEERKRGSLSFSLFNKRSNNNDIKPKVLKPYSKITHQYVKHEETIKDYRKEKLIEKWLNEQDNRILNSFNDPKLRKNVLVQLTRCDNLVNGHLQKSQNTIHRSPVAFSPRLTHKSIDLIERPYNEKSSNLASMRLNSNKIDMDFEELSSTVTPKVFIHESARKVDSDEISQARHKNADSSSGSKENILVPKLLFKDKSTDMSDLKSALVKKRRSSVDSVIVVRVFTDKNNRIYPTSMRNSVVPHQSMKQPIVLIRRLKTKDLFQYNINIHKNEGGKKKRRDRSKHKSRARRKSEYIEVADYWHTVNGKRNRSRSEGMYTENGRNYQLGYEVDPKHCDRASPMRKNICELPEGLSETNIFYSLNKKRHRSKSVSKSWENNNKGDEEYIYKRPRSKSTSISRTRSRLEPDILPDIRDRSYLNEISNPKKVNGRREVTIDLFNYNRHKKEDDSLSIEKQLKQEPDSDSDIERSINLPTNEQENDYLLEDITQKNVDYAENYIESESLNLIDEFSDPSPSFTLPLDLTNKLCSPLLSVSDRISLSNSADYCESSDFRLDQEITSENVNEAYDELSSQFGRNYVPEKELNSTQENSIESESPLLILSDPSDGVLAILPKRKKMLDSINSNDSIQEGDDNTNLETIEREPTKRKHYVRKLNNRRQTIATFENDFQISGKSPIHVFYDNGTESPEINVNLDTAKTYSKSNLVQNVFVPPELEMNFEDVSKISKVNLLRQGLSNSSVA